jgi:hypothetical protein
MSKLSITLPPLTNLKIEIDAVQMLKDNSTFSYTVHYEKDETNYLASLCDKYGSDKGEIKTSGHPYVWPSHTYTDYVDARFRHCRELVKNVFECGLGTMNPQFKANMGIDAKPGASLRVWRDYFPNANIFGADIDKSILFEEERIKTFHVDQTNKDSIAAMWNQISVSNFDLMIDDGLHEFPAGVSLFENSVPHLSEKGLYIIEDVNSYDMLRYRSYFAGRRFHVEYVTLTRGHIPMGDNQLVVIRHKPERLP